MQTGANALAEAKQLVAMARGTTDADGVVEGYISYYMHRPSSLFASVKSSWELRPPLDAVPGLVAAAKRVAALKKFDANLPTIHAVRLDRLDSYRLWKKYQKAGGATQAGQQQANDDEVDVDMEDDDDDDNDSETGEEDAEMEDDDDDNDENEDGNEEEDEDEPEIDLPHALRLAGQAKECSLTDGPVTQNNRPGLFFLRRHQKEQWPRKKRTRADDDAPAPKPKAGAKATAKAPSRTWQTLQHTSWQHPSRRRRMPSHSRLHRPSFCRRSRRPADHGSHQTNER